MLLKRSSMHIRLYPLRGNNSCSWLTLMHKLQADESVTNYGSL